MTEPLTPQTAPQVWRPCGRAFFVYYVAMSIALFGPSINPAVGVPVWLGVVFAVLIGLAVAYNRFGQEYRATSRGVVKTWLWPRREQFIPWQQVGVVEARRGLTQSLLQVGNVVIQDRSGGEEMFWYGLPRPKDVKAAVEARRQAGEEGAGD
jgi:hypothetical protein